MMNTFFMLLNCPSHSGMLLLLWIIRIILFSHLACTSSRKNYSSFFIRLLSSIKIEFSSSMLSFASPFENTWPVSTLLRQVFE